jgi:hypothetical protein
MRAQRVVLSFVVMIVGGITAAGSALSEEYRGTYEQQMACTPDVWRLCFDQIPDANRITACLRQNTPQLSGPCRAVFESNDSAREQAPPLQRRNNQPNNPPRTYDNQYRYNQYQ